MIHSCYHCDQREAASQSNFCTACQSTSRPLFFPHDRRSTRAQKAKTGLLYAGASVALVYLAIKTVELYLTSK